jgi:glycosyltransferase involved in cell wall biosynthesis
MNRGPAARIGIGMFLHNEERYVAEAISSLLAQTFPAFELFVVDDCSTDSTASIVARFAEQDSRVRLFRNDTRTGYGANYLRTFAHAKPGHVYWAWAAGHDRHDPKWLSTMVGALDANPAAVLAYPLTVRVSETGARYPEYPPLRFQTLGMDLRVRIEALRRSHYRAGDMIYGLFRVAALKEAGIFPQLLLPDVFLIWRLAQFGTVIQVPEELWFRRFVGLFSLQRQRRVMFSSAPWYTYLPWPLVNTVALFVDSVLRPKGLKNRRSGARLTIAYFLRYWPYVILSSPRLARLSERPIQFLLARRAGRRNA